MANFNLWGIVDMGSNGIRFSITDLSPLTARILPAVFTDRAGISLYDAQYSDGQKVPIPEDVINSVSRALRRFKRTCKDFGVPDDQIRVLATEATRVAINSDAYRARIKAATGWEVELLAKEDEGRTGAYGVASSFESVRGLMMDLGGGSTQLTWLIAKEGNIRMSDAGSISMPYGAAALTQRLAEAKKQGVKGMTDLREEMVSALKAAVDKINLPEELLQEIEGPNGLNLYLSGGGFRGWGYLLMSEHPIKPYPIPIINGFKTTTSSFHNTTLVKASAQDDTEVFRVSGRRADQVPAVALLVDCLTEALPKITNVYFAQGGVREGSLFANLSPEHQTQHPLETATNEHAPPSAGSISQILMKSTPIDLNLLRARGWVHRHIVQAFAQSMYIHTPLNKDIQAAAALRSTTTGALAAVHGADHEERALLAIMLCERWGGSRALSPADQDFQRKLAGLLEPEPTWWAMYFGRVAAVLAEVYPAGIVDERESLVKIGTRWVDKSDADDSDDPTKSEHEDKKHKKHDQNGKDKKKKKQVLLVGIVCDEDTLSSESFQKAVHSLEKLGKKKHWLGPAGGSKIRIETTVGVLGKTQFNL